MAARSLADLQGHAGPTRLEIEERSEIDADAVPAARLGCTPGARLLRLRGLRRRADAAAAPISSVEMHVPTEFAAAAKRPEVGTTQIYRLTERHLGLPIVAMEQEIGALALDRASARSLGARSGPPGLLIIRRFFGPDHKLVEATVNIHSPIGAFTYAIRLGAPEGALTGKHSQGEMRRWCAASPRS